MSKRTWRRNILCFAIPFVLPVLVFPVLFFWIPFQTPFLSALPPYFMEITSPVDAILPGKLYLGDAEAASSLPLLRRLTVTHILNAAEELPDYFPEGPFIYHRCELFDDPVQPVAFQAPLAFLRSALAGVELPFKP